MAFTATVIKQSVGKVGGVDDYMVTINVSVEDGGEVFNKDYSLRYNSTTTIGDIQAEFENMLQADWDDYIAEKTIFDAAAFDTMVSSIQSVANIYMNP